jgi:exosortase
MSQTHTAGIPSMENPMISTGADGALATPGAGAPPSAWGLLGRSPAWRWALAVASLVLAAAYAPNLVELGRSWYEDENYSHGFLVIPIALGILWRRLSDVPWEEPRDVASAPWWGWALLAVVLIVRAVAYERSLQWVETATLLPAVACLTWAFGGWPLLYRAWPAILFLVFMLPLPLAMNGLVALPLQRIAATGSNFVLQLSGFWVIQNGNVLNVSTPRGTEPLDVALACSGLKMLMTLAATVTATVLLLPMPRWKQITLLISAVPIALVSNISRIVATGWCYYYITSEGGRHWAHDISGWMMMPLALILVGLELVLLSWLACEDVPDEGKETILPGLTDKKKPGGSPASEGVHDEGDEKIIPGLAAKKKKPGGWRTSEGARDEGDEKIIPGLITKKKPGENSPGSLH